VEYSAELLRLRHGCSHCPIYLV